MVNEMIYIKDYRSINDQIPGKQGDRLPGLLSELKGKAVTVYTCGCVNGITGILVDVFPDSIGILTRMPPTPQYGHSRKRQGRRAFGTKTVVLLKHIEAISYNYV